jgi:hypothetical protein
MTIHQLHPQGAPLTWTDLLRNDETEADVLASAREFVATVTPQEVALLPVEIRPGRLVDANDVTSYAFDLMRAHWREDEAAHAVAHRLASFFSNASIRLSEIMARDRREHAPADDAQRSA